MEPNPENTSFSASEPQELSGSHTMLSFVTELKHFLQETIEDAIRERLSGYPNFCKQRVVSPPTRAIQLAQNAVLSQIYHMYMTMSVLSTKRYMYDKDLCWAIIERFNNIRSFLSVQVEFTMEILKKEEVANSIALLVESKLDGVRCMMMFAEDSFAWLQKNRPDPAAPEQWLYYNILNLVCMFENLSISVVQFHTATNALIPQELERAWGSDVEEEGKKLDRLLLSCCFWATTEGVQESRNLYNLFRWSTPEELASVIYGSCGRLRRMWIMYQINRHSKRIRRGLTI